MTVNRRRAGRRAPLPAEPLSRVRLRAGRELAVLDISAGGALVEGDVRLLPGTHLDVHVITGEGRVLVRSRVVRACVSLLDADRVTYRGAFSFDRAIDVLPAGYAMPEKSVAGDSEASSLYPDRAA